MTAPVLSSQPNMTGFPNEEILPDDYPVYGDYLYVADGKLYKSDWHGITIRSLKIHENFAEVRRCNVQARRAALSPAAGNGESK